MRAVIGPGAWFYELLAAVGVPSDAGAAGSRTAVRDRETLSDQYIPCATHVYSPQKSETAIGMSTVRNRDSNLG